MQDKKGQEIKEKTILKNSKGRYYIVSSVNENSFTANFINEKLELQGEIFVQGAEYIKDYVAVAYAVYGIPKELFSL